MKACAIIILGGLLTAMSIGASGDTPAFYYLSDRPASIAYSQQAWGELGIDVAAHAAGQTPLGLRIKDTSYTKGLGHHAPGEIVVDLDGEYESFEAKVGVQWQGGNVGSVVFQVFVDDEKRFDSGVMRETDAAKQVMVTLAGAQELRLVVTDAGDGITCDCADWAEARLIASSSPTPKRRQEPFDVAPFARVATWDPERMDGCRSNRVEEFRAEDLFLESELHPNANGSYTAPVRANGGSCIGLQWLERRRLKEVALELTDGTHRLPTDHVQVQAWVGESALQGSWKPLKGAIEIEDHRWTFRIDYQENPEVRMGVRKIRWVFAGSIEPPVIRRMLAFTWSKSDTIEIGIYPKKPTDGERCELEVYNGAILDASGASTKRAWETKHPVLLTVRYCKPRPWESDRTVLILRLPAGSFGVAIDDILANGSVYVADPGFYVTREPVETRLYDYIRNTSHKETILDRVRRAPDQTLEQAMARTRNPIQDNGPMLLSLACDNHKFIANREGTIEFSTRPELADESPWAKLTARLVPVFGSGKNEKLSRKLDGGWLPMPVTTVVEGGIVYSQRTCVVAFSKENLPQAPDWLNRRPVCLAEFQVANQGSAVSDASLRLKLAIDEQDAGQVEISQVAQGWIAQSGGRLLALVDTTAAKPLSARLENGELILSGPIRPSKTAKALVYIPAWEVKSADHDQLAGGQKLIARSMAYWMKALSPGMEIELPDEFLINAIRASQVHCLIAARSEENGTRVAPWIASMSYGPLESESNSIIRGMALMGQEDFARRSLDFFIRRYNPAGFLTTGYTMMGTGWHLWSLGEYYQLTHDDEWMRRVAPEVNRVCRWITVQRDKTKKLSGGRKVAEYGLMPPGVMADWNVFSYYYCLNGYYYAGLKAAAEALDGVGNPDAGSLLRNAEEFRKEILRAYEWTQSRMPVVPLRDGTWVPGYPSQVFVPGPTNNFFPGEDGNRSWCYDVELGAHQLVPQGVLNPNSREVLWMMEHMEDVQFMHSGWFDYPAERNEKDYFNMGGFAKVQPYYCRNAEIYAMRDEVKPFIRSYFNALAAMISRENMSFWEHFHTSGAWNKTHETGYFLQQTRFMLVMERGDQLWLAPFVTSNWMRNGMHVAARNAPTRFGPVGYKITSHVDEGYIEAQIDPPTRNAPNQIVIRLRHPNGRHMRSVTVNGARHTEFDPQIECVYLKPAKGTITVRAEY